MPRQIPKDGDVFLVPLEDGSLILGQILEAHPVLMNSITCAFFNIRICESEKDWPSFPSRDLILTCQFVTRDAFSRGKWTRIKNMPVCISKCDFPYRDKEASGWIGAKVIGAGIITSFLNAYFGMGDWHEMNDPEYYERLLFADAKRT